MAEGVTTGDLALMKNNYGLLGGGGGVLLVILAIFFLMFGFGGMGGRGPAGPAPASSDQVAQGFLNQNMQNILLSSANNNYETARLIDNQTNLMIQQNNANQVNVIQGFNAITLMLQNLSSKLDTCCCDIKTQMLQDKLAEANAAKVALQNEISNYQQSQFLLQQTGRWVGWIGSGSQTAPST